MCRNDLHAGGRGRTMDVSIRDKGVYAFGPYRLDPVRRTLLRDTAPVTLPPRLFDTLLYLVENAGQIVERDELLRVVWGGRVVEDANINQTIFALRRALQADGGDERYIVTAPTRGYRFAAPVRYEVDAVTAPFTATEGAPPAVRKKNYTRERAWPTRAALLAGLVMVAACVALAWGLLAGTKRQDAVVTAHFVPPPHSVAVLAFTNMSRDSGQEYFSDGISEEVINALSRVDELRVVARTSAFSFKGKSATIADIARQLNVGAVLEGTVRREGARVRITADLVSATTGFELWSASYDRDEQDLLNVQGEIARSVAASLQVALLQRDTAKLTLGGTSHARALDAYLRGMVLLHKARIPINDASGATMALAEFDAAISIDANYASARAARSAALISIAVGGADLPLARQALDDARQEAERAIALAPSLPAAHLSRGYALRESLDFISADKEFSLARNLAPGDADTELSYSEMQLTNGHVAAAISAAELAVQLDPLTPSTYYTLSSRLSYAGRYNEAFVAYRHGKALDQVGEPTSEGLMFYGLGQYEAALQACAGQKIWVGPFCLALAYHKLGRQMDAASQLAKLQATVGEGAPFQYAEIYSQWGRIADALRWLDAAYKIRDAGLTYLKCDPFLDPIRDTPEFKDIERRLNFPP
jgi:TolB-like protein/DNA-binding winged helix-turn-helix (wHTH) protein/tetratricopeptide (TPR) repeat protein